MKTIKSSNSELEILVDDEDFEFLSRFKWSLNDRGYASGSLQDGLDPVFMHRYLMNPKNGEMVHHVDGNRLNNQKRNLKIVNQSSHSATFSYQRNNTSGYKGVSFDKARGKFMWYIEKDKVRYQGRCDTAMEAAM